jgi:hypothetical protein
MSWLFLGIHKLWLIIYDSSFQLVLADDGHLHMISGSGQCRDVFHVGESSFIPLLLQPSASRQSDAYILIGTKDGSLMSVGIYNTSVERDASQSFGGTCRIGEGTHDVSSN